MIKILSYQKLDKGFLKGSLSILVEDWGLEIYDMKIFEKDRTKWISFPSRQYEKDGQKCFAPYLKFPSKEQMAAFSHAVFKAVEQFEGMPLSKTPHFKEEEYLPF